MSVSPGSGNIYAKLDTIIRFSIHITSDKTIKKFRITRDIVGSTVLTLLDTTISAQPFEMNFDYLINEDITSNKMVLNFYCSDESGRSFTVLRSLLITDFEYPLQETAGHVMYSTKSGKNSAYDLIEGVQRIWNDPLPKDIEDRFIDSSYSIGRSWKSPDSLQFVVFNTFDYANATNRTAKNGFDAGIKQALLNNLQEGDIIITKLNRNNYKNYFVVIKITGIIDNDSTQNDYYLFNLKKK